MDAVGIEPCWFWGLVPVVALVDFTGVAAGCVGQTPSAFRIGCADAKDGPGLRVLRMLQHSTPFADGCERGGETAVVVTELKSFAVALEAAAPQSAPSFARRVGNDRPGAAVVACVAFFVPEIDVVEAAIRAFGFGVQDGYLDHRTMPIVSKAI